MLKYVLKNEKDYWKLISSNTQVPSYGQQFLEMMASLTRWRGEDVPEKVGTVKLTQAVTLLPKQEYLLWGRLPSNVPKSTMEHSYCGAYHLQVCASGHHGGESGHAAVGRWLDLLKITNISDKPLTLRKNSKLADVSPCVASSNL